MKKVLRGEAKTARWLWL